MARTGAPFPLRNGAPFLGIPLVYRPAHRIIFLGMPSVRVLLFASYADALGASAIDVELTPDARVRDILSSVLARSGAHRLPPSPMVALNAEYAQMDDLVTERDEVAIIPPVAGG